MFECGISASLPPVRSHRPANSYISAFMLCKRSLFDKNLQILTPPISFNLMSIYILLARLHLPILPIPFLTAEILHVEHLKALRYSMSISRPCPEVRKPKVFFCSQILIFQPFCLLIIITAARTR